MGTMVLNFTLGFVRHNDQFLMLFRNKPPNQYKWNGVGGKIEHGESPHEAMVREIREESGIVVDDVHFRGIVTWQNRRQTYVGGMYVFVADSPTDRFVAGEEGKLQWKTLDWIINSGKAVSNIPIFLPPMLDEDQRPLHYSFLYDDRGNIQSYGIKPVAESILTSQQSADKRGTFQSR